MTEIAALLDYYSQTSSRASWGVFMWYYTKNTCWNCLLVTIHIFHMHMYSYTSQDNRLPLIWVE